MQNAAHGNDLTYRTATHLPKHDPLINVGACLGVGRVTVYHFARMSWLPSVGSFFSFNPRALIFDVAVLGGNLFLLDRLAMVGEDGTDRQVGVLLVAALISQLLGALLKIGPLRFRLYEEKTLPSENRSNVLGCLAFAGFILYTVVAAMALALSGLLSPPDAGGDTPDIIWIGVSIVISFLIASAVWYAASPPEQPVAGRRWYPVSELGADILLYISALIITALFWSSWQQLVAPGFGAGFSVKALILVLGSCTWSRITTTRWPG